MTTAQAQTTNKFISSGGNDTNNCSRTAPCKTLQRGLDATASAAVLQILDSGAYGPATIIKSVTVDATGVTATTQAITINKNDAVVTLRNLLVSGRGVADGTNGITITAAFAVHIENCQIERFPNNGIRQSGVGELYIFDSNVRDNAGNGLLVNNGASKLTVESSRFENNTGPGILLGQIRAVISRSVVAANTGAGLEILGSTAHVVLTTASHNGLDGFLIGSAAEVTLDQVTASNNAAAGVSVSAASTVRISNSAVTNNATGIANNATVLTRQNNVVSGNTTNLSGTALAVLGGT